MKARHGGRTTCGSLEHRDEGNASVRSLLGRWQEGPRRFWCPSSCWVVLAGLWRVGPGPWDMESAANAGERLASNQRQAQKQKPKATSKHRQQVGKHPSQATSPATSKLQVVAAHLVCISSVQFSSVRRALSAERSIWASLIQCPARLHRRLTNCPHSR